MLLKCQTSERDIILSHLFCLLRTMFFDNLLPVIKYIPITDSTLVSSLAIKTWL